MIFRCPVSHSFFYSSSNTSHLTFFYQNQAELALYSISVADHRSGLDRMGRATNLRRGARQRGQDGGGSSSSSSTESNHVETGGHDSSPCCLSTDLRLGLTFSSNSDHTCSSSRHNCNEWPQIPSLFVKVNMEGIPIGRKLDLMSHDGYRSLVSTLSHMFKVPILCPDVNYKHISEIDHILTYEDKDGDWMLVGDVPWELFLSTVKKLRISKADNGSS